MRAGGDGLLLSLYPPDSIAHERSNIFEFEFLFDVAAMDINGFRAQVEVFGDFPRAFALADKLQDFEFPVAKFLDRRAGAAWAPARQ